MQHTSESIIQTAAELVFNELRAASTELLLAALFCTGYFIFRLHAVQGILRRFTGGGKNKKGKDFGDFATTTWAPTPSRRRKQVASFESEGIAVNALDAAGTAAKNAVLGTSAADLGRLRACLRQRDVDGALHALAAACANEAPAPPVECLASVLHLLRQTSAANDAPSPMCRLPSRALRGPEGVAALVEYGARVNDMDLLQEVREYINANNVVLSNGGYEALIRGFVASADSRAEEVFDELLRSGFDPSPTFLAVVVGLCAEPRHVLLAERLFGHARTFAASQGGASVTLYAAMMKVYSHSRLWHKTCDLYEVLRQESVELDTVTSGSVIKAAVESGRLELARQLFKETERPDLLNYMALIRAAGREHDVPKAMQLLSELEESGVITPDTTVYNCVLEACTACGDVATATGLLRRMEGTGHIDVVSYNTYLKVVLAKDAPQEVDALLQSMRAQGIRPNVVTYNSMIRDAVSRQDLARGWQLTEEMEPEGITADAFTCSILMKGSKHTMRSQEVDRVLDLIRRANVTPDEVLTNCLLDACVRLNDVQRLTQVLDQFKASGVVPSPHAYATLIRAYGHARRSDRAWALWRDLCAMGGVGAPDEEAFAGMVEACLSSGDIAGAAAVFREVLPRLEQFSRAPVAFGATVRACMQAKKPDLATDLYIEVKESIMCNKVTFNTLIDALVRQSDMERAGEVFQDMVLKNCAPDLITYSTLIKGHCAKGDLERALQLFGTMQRRGIAPDAVLFNSILDGCVHKQMRGLTEQVLRDMDAAGVAPSNFTLSILVKLYSRCKDLDAAMAVVDTFPQKYSFELNAQVYTCLMSACIAAGELPRALELYDRMGNAGCPRDAKTYQTLLVGCVRANDAEAGCRLLRDALEQNPPARLERESVEGVLLLAVRRGHAADLAEPLLDLLPSGGAGAVSERALCAVRRAAAAEPIPTR